MFRLSISLRCQKKKHFGLEQLQSQRKLKTSKDICYNNEIFFRRFLPITRLILLKTPRCGSVEAVPTFLNFTSFYLLKKGKRKWFKVQHILTGTNSTHKYFQNHKQNHQALEDEIFQSPESRQCKRLSGYQRPTESRNPIRTADALVTWDDDEFRPTETLWFVRQKWCFDTQLCSVKLNWEWP